MIGFNEAASKFRFGEAVTKTSPRLWEENANATGYPLDLPCHGGSAAGKHDFGHAMGMPFGVSERHGRHERGRSRRHESFYGQQMARG